MVLFCHGSHNSVKNVDGVKGETYVKLECNEKGNFISTATTKSVNIHKVYCGKPLEPEIRQVLRQKPRCADIGADDRKHDLDNYIRAYQIGWNMAPMKNIGIKKKFEELVMRDCL